MLSILQTFVINAGMNMRKQEHYSQIMNEIKYLKPDQFKLIAIKY